MTPDEIRDMPYSRIAPRLRVIHARQAQLAGKHRLSRADEQEASELSDEVTALDARRSSLERSHQLAHGDDNIRYENGGGGTDPYDRDDERPHDPLRGQRDKAMATLERHVQVGSMAAEGAEVVERLCDTGSVHSRSWTARYAAATGSDEYTRAFAKLVASPVQGHLRWTAREAEAFRVVEGLRQEQRDMGLTDTLGGYLLPVQLDPNIWLTSAGSINPIPAIARTVTIATDQWRGVTSAGVTSSWKGEAVEADDNSPTIEQPVIPVEKSMTFVPFSFEIFDDGMNFMQELGSLLYDGYQQQLAAAFVNGTGVGQPTGIITSLTGSGSSSVVNSIGTDVLSPADVYNLQNQLPPRFQANSQWAASLTTLNALRQFTTANGSFEFPELRTSNPTLAGKPVNEVSNMAGAPVAGQENYVLAVGDWQQYLIVSRIGASLELIPQLFDPAHNRPKGERGALYWARIGADTLVSNAFRVLNCT